MIQTLVNTCIIICTISMIIASAIDVIFKTAVKDLFGIELIDDYEDINSFNIMTKGKNISIKPYTYNQTILNTNNHDDIKMNSEIEDILNSIVDKIVFENNS